MQQCYYLTLDQLKILTDAGGIIVSGPAATENGCTDICNPSPVGSGSGTGTPQTTAYWYCLGEPAITGTSPPVGSGTGTPQTAPYWYCLDEPVVTGTSFPVGSGTGTPQTTPYWYCLDEPTQSGTSPPVGSGTGTPQTASYWYCLDEPVATGTSPPVGTSPGTGTPQTALHWYCLDEPDNPETKWYCVPDDPITGTGSGAYNWWCASNEIYPPTCFYLSNEEHLSMLRSGWTFLSGPHANADACATACPINTGTGTGTGTGIVRRLYCATAPGASSGPCSTCTLDPGDMLAFLVDITSDNCTDCNNASGTIFLTRTEGNLCVWRSELLTLCGVAAYWEVGFDVLLGSPRRYARLLRASDSYVYCSYEILVADGSDCSLPLTLSLSTSGEHSCSYSATGILTNAAVGYSGTTSCVYLSNNEKENLVSLGWAITGSYSTIHDCELACGITTGTSGDTYDWYCLQDSYGLGNCYSLTSGQLQVFEALGYTIIGGPFVTETHCANECVRTYWCVIAPDTAVQSCEYVTQAELNALIVLGYTPLAQYFSESDCQNICEVGTGTGIPPCTATQMTVGVGATFGEGDCDVCSAINGGGGGAALPLVGAVGEACVWELDYGSLNCSSGTISPFKMTATITTTTVTVSFTGETATWTGSAIGWDGVSTLTATYDGNGSTLCSWPASLDITPS